jgi:L-fucose isomerase-like protein
MLTILPIASSFHAADQVAAAVARISAELEAQGLAHRMVDAAAGAEALLIVTGGTEHLALEAASGQPGPVLLLAHPSQNSLPAAMEVLALLRQSGRAGRILLLNGAPGGQAALAAAAGHLALRKRLAATRLGRIGAPSDWLVASSPDPERVAQVWGPQVVDVALEDVRAAIEAADPAEAAEVERTFRAGARCIVEPSAGDLALAARVAVGLQAVVRAHRLDACTVRCFDLVTGLGTTGCLALSALLDAGVVAGCEGDLPAALTMLWLQAMSGQLSFMANPQDLDPAAGTLWLAHCTIARGLVRNYALRSHFESGLGVGIQGELAPGPVTLARIGGADLRSLFVADGDLLGNGTSDLRCRTQIQVRLDEGVGTLLEQPLGNHHVLVSGHWAAALRDYHSLMVGAPERP